MWFTCSQISGEPAPKFFIVSKRQFWWSSRFILPNKALHWNKVPHQMNYLLGGWNIVLSSRWTNHNWRIEGADFIAKKSTRRHSFGRSFGCFGHSSIFLTSAWSPQFNYFIRVLCETPFSIRTFPLEIMCILFLKFKFPSKFFLRSTTFLATVSGIYSDYFFLSLLPEPNWWVRTRHKIKAHVFFCIVSLSWFLTTLPSHSK